MRVQRRSGAVVPHAVERQRECRMREHRRDEESRLFHSGRRLDIHTDAVALAAVRKDLLRHQQRRTGLQHARSRERYALRQQRRPAELERQRAQHAGALQTRARCRHAIQISGAQRLYLLSHAALGHFEDDLRDRHIGIPIVDDRYVLQHDAAHATIRVQLVRPHFLGGKEADLESLRRVESGKRTQGSQRHQHPTHGEHSPDPL